MQQIIDGLKRSASIKAFVIGALILILLIPVSMIKGVVHDRIQVHDQARADIMRSWGGEQLLTGPILVLPYRVTHRNSYGNQVVETEFAFVLPSDLNIEIDTNPEVRYRGIHKVPIYSATMSISGEFNSPDTAVLPANITQVEWQKAFVALSVSDARAIANTPVINVGGSVSRFTSGGTIVLCDAETPIVAALDSDLEKYREGEPLSFNMELQLNGADSLRVSPLGDTTNVTVTSSWPSPSFVGADRLDSGAIAVATSRSTIAGQALDRASHWIPCWPADFSEHKYRCSQSIRRPCRCIHIVSDSPQ